MSSYAQMTRDELIERIHALESALALQDQRDETQRLLHQMEMQSRELRHTRQALEDSRNRYVELYDGAPVGCLTLTPQGRIVGLNLAAAAMLGLDRDQVQNLPLASRLSPGQSGLLFQHLGQIFAGDAPRSIDLVMESADGQWSDVQLTSRATQDPDHGAVCHTVMMDVTERKRAAAALQESQERLQQLAARLTDADRHKNAFLAMLGYELRNPLAAVRLVIDAFRLRQAEIPPPLRQGLEIVEGQMTLLCRLVDDLLDIARLSLGRISFKKVRIDLAESITQAVQSQQALIESRRQQLSLALPPQPLLLDADPNRLAQMIGNLLNNAAKFTGEGGSIKIAARREGAEAVIEVSDTGQGIASGLLAQLFQPFVQGETSLNRPYGGLGLGLTLVRQLAGLHGGQVQAASPGPGKGSTFTLRLPITNDGGRQALPSPATSAATPRRILVVEDEPPVAQALDLVLKSLGHTVRVVGDAESAESAVAEFRPEVVLVDIGLPDMDGCDVARRLRATYPDMTLTLIALSGYGRAEDIARAEAAGFDRHLLKPASVAQLYQALAAVPRRGG